ncbi:Cytidylate kinase [Lachnospiraceae bacterium XBB2008]|nr:cytidylate kinase-like family protein [Lachnospiraceae bacterium]SCY41264.1 Cytidylate kinase [Lachnospiraceae bacterium XBB2008]
MDKYIVTISRQFGSLGRSIAAELASRLGVEYLDRDIVEETAKRMGQNVSDISNAEEISSAPFLRRAFPLGKEAGLRDSIFEVQKNIIRDFAKEQSGIVVGRCADHVLADHPRLLSVYIYAPVEARLINCVERLGMEEKVARKMIADVDTAREQYHKAYIPSYKNPFSGRDLCIDSSRFGVEGTAEILEHIVKERFYD